MQDLSFGVIIIAVTWMLVTPKYEVKTTGSKTTGPNTRAGEAWYQYGKQWLKAENEPIKNRE